MKTRLSRSVSLHCDGSSQSARITPGLLVVLCGMVLTACSEKPQTEAEMLVDLSKNYVGVWQTDADAYLAQLPQARSGHDAEAIKRKARAELHLGADGSFRTLIDGKEVAAMTYRFVSGDESKVVLERRYDNGRTSDVEIVRRDGSYFFLADGKETKLLKKH